MSSATSSLGCAMLTGIAGGDGYLLIGRAGGANLVPFGYVVVLTPLYLLQGTHTFGISSDFEARNLIDLKTVFQLSHS